MSIQYSHSSYQSTLSVSTQNENKSFNNYLEHSPLPSYFVNKSNSNLIEQKIKNPSIQFEELFQSEESLIDYIQFNTKQFSDFLTKRFDILELMIQYMLFPENMSATFQQKTQYAYISLQVFELCNTQLSHFLLFEKQSLLHTIFSFLEKDQLDPSFTAYFSSIIEIFLNKNLGNIWTYLQNNHFILENLIIHIDTIQIAEIIIKLLTKRIIKDYYISQKQQFIDKIIEAYYNLPQIQSVTEDSEKEENFAYVIKGIFIESANKDIPNENAKKLSTYILQNQKLLQMLFDRIKISKNNFSLHYSLQIINEIASQEQEYQYVTKLFVENLEFIFNSLSQDQGLPKIKTSYGEEIQQFGSGKLMALRVISNLLFWNKKKQIIKKIASLNIYQTIIHLALDYKWNNMLHCVIMDLIINSLKSEDEDIFQSFLFSNIDVLNLIVENYRKKYLFTVFKNQKTKNQVKKGNVGFLTKLARFLDDPDQPDAIYNHFQESDTWQNFIKDKLNLISEIWESSLGEDDRAGSQSMIEQRWKSFNDTTGKMQFLKRMSIITIEEKAIQQQKRKSQFVMTDPQDPTEILLNMALNGCGRKDTCQNEYCLDNPKNKKNPYTEADINKVIKEQILSRKLVVYPCNIYEILYQHKNKELENNNNQENDISSDSYSKSENSLSDSPLKNKNKSNNNLQIQNNINNSNINNNTYQNQNYLSVQNQPIQNQPIKLEENKTISIQYDTDKTNFTQQNQQIQNTNQDNNKFQINNNYNNNNSYQSKYQLNHKKNLEIQNFSQDFTNKNPISSCLSPTFISQNYQSFKKEFNQTENNKKSSSLDNSPKNNNTVQTNTLYQINLQLKNKLDTISISNNINNNNNFNSNTTNYNNQFQKNQEKQTNFSQQINSYIQNNQSLQYQQQYQNQNQAKNNLNNNSYLNSLYSKNPTFSIQKPEKQVQPKVCKIDISKEEETHFQNDNKIQNPEKPTIDYYKNKYNLQKSFTQQQNYIQNQVVNKSAIYGYNKQQSNYNNQSLNSFQKFQIFQQKKLESNQKQQQQQQQIFSPQYQNYKSQINNLKTGYGYNTNSSYQLNLGNYSYNNNINKNNNNN